MDSKGKGNRDERRELDYGAILNESSDSSGDHPEVRPGPRSHQRGAPVRRTRTGVTLQAVNDGAQEFRSAPEDVLIEEDLAAAEASNTRRAYISGWRRFESWCAGRDYVALPASPRTVARYFAAAARERRGEDFRYKASTFGVWLAAIGDQHASAGHEHPGQDPLVARTLRGIRRRRTAAGEAPRQAAPLLTEHLHTIVHAVGDGARGWKQELSARRDIALLVLGFTGALRREELAQLEIRDFAPAGDRDGDWLAIHLRGSKASPEDAEYVYVPRGRTSARSCPWCVLLRWMALVSAYDTASETAKKHAGEREWGVRESDPVAAAQYASDAGMLAVQRLLRREASDPDTHTCDRPWPRAPRTTVALFRSLSNGVLPRDPRPLTGESVERVLRRRATQAGIDPALVAQFSAHALRAGAATEAFDRGASLEEVMNMTRHKSVTTVRRYDRNPRHKRNAAGQLGV